MNFTVETEQETDGRWIAEVPQLPGVLAYGSTQDEALAKHQEATAQTQQPKKEAPQRRTELNFGEGSEIIGEPDGPSASYFLEPTRKRFTSLIKIRENFNDKLRASINEL